MNDFGRHVDLQHRFDDFAKLHESLSSIPGFSLPPLPQKNMFGGNDPKVIEERRPMLEKLVRECIVSEQALSDSQDYLCKFLDISSSGSTVVKFLCPSTRAGALPKLVELLKPDAPDNYRLFNESVVRVLLHLLRSQEPKTVITCLDVLQFVLSRADHHPLASSVDIQSIFVALGGISIVWHLICSNKDIREHCRRVLSSLIASNSGKIHKYEEFIFFFLQNQNGVSLLADCVSDEGLHEITAKLLWFGLSPAVQGVISQHRQGLALLGRLFSSPDVNARCLSGLTLSVLITAGNLDACKSDRAVEGVSSILGSLVTSTGDNAPSPQFFSGLCRGSSNGLERILFCVDHGTSPMSDLCSYVLLNANLSLELIDSAKIVQVIENALLNNPSESVLAMNCSRFLFRLYQTEGRLPSSRTDGRLPELLNRVRDGLASYNKTSRQLVTAEHTQFSEFQKGSISAQLNRINGKKVEAIDFLNFELVVKQYLGNRETLTLAVQQSEEDIANLGQAVRLSADNDQWMYLSQDLVKEWNQSSQGMLMVYRRLDELREFLNSKESESKAASADAENLQNVISKMREEMVSVDSKAEEFRKESSRFTAAASGAVDPDLMLQRATENETKAKEEITKREALRQSQDSLEAQLEGFRKVMVLAETGANETRKSINETLAALAVAEKQHQELEARMRAEMSKAMTQWSSKIDRSKDQLAQVGSIMSRFKEINAMTETENEQKDLLATIIGDLVMKLQRLQMQLQ